MPKKMREGLSDVETLRRSEITLKLHLNLSLCYYKKEMKGEVIKQAEAALEIDPQCAKAHFRVYQAHMLNNDFDKAHTALRKAIDVEPNNLHFRQEWGVLKEIKNKKEREWAGKMKGFLNRDDIQNLEEEDAREKELKDKVW